MSEARTRVMRIDVELYGVSVTGEDERTIREALDSAWRDELDRLGMPCDGLVSLSARSAGPPRIAVRVHDAPLALAPALVCDVWETATGISLEVDAPHSAVAVHRALADAISHCAAAEAAVGLVAVMLAAIRTKPSLLLGRDEALAVADGLHANPQAVASILLALLDLGVSLHDREQVLAAIADGIAEGLGSADVVEYVLAAVADRSVTLRAAPLAAPTMAEWADDAEEIPAKILADLGLMIPPIELVADPGIVGGFACLDVGEVPGPPIPIAADLLDVVVSGMKAAGGRVLTIEDVETHLAVARGEMPHLIDAATTMISLGDLTRVLRSLLLDALPISDLRTILDRLLRYESIVLDDDRDLWLLEDRLALPRWIEIEPAAAYAAFARGAFRSVFAERYAPRGRVRAVRVDAETEVAVTRYAGSRSGLAPPDAARVREEVTAAAEAASRDGAGVVVLASVWARAGVRDVLTPALPHLPVLSYFDLPPSVEVELVPSAPVAS